QNPACLLVEGDEERSRLLLVAIDYQTVLVQDRRAGRSPTVAHVGNSELPAPDKLSREVVTVHTRIAEECIDVGAVGHRSMGSVAVLHVARGVRPLLERRLLPEQRAAVAVKA